MLLPWPVLCTIAALVVLLVLVIRYQMQAYVALILVSLGLGLAAGMPPDRVLRAFGKGVGDIAAGVAVILALGAMLGRMLDVSGAAQVIARTLIDAFGLRHAALAILVAAYIIGIPVLFNVGFLLLIPIMWRLQRETGQSLLHFALPLSFGLGIAHSLIPPHPGIVGAVGALTPPAIAGQVMVQTIICGTLLGIPLLLVGWFGPGLWWARRQYVEPPPGLAGEQQNPTPQPPPRSGEGEKKDLTPQPPPRNREGESESPSPPRGGVGERSLRAGVGKGALGPSFGLCLLIVVLPLLLSLLGFGVTLLSDLHYLPIWFQTPPLDPAEGTGWLAFLAHPPRSWLQFLGSPAMAMLVTTGLAFWLLGARRGLNRRQLAKIAGDGLNDVGAMLFLFTAAGGFKEVIEATRAGEQIARLFLELPLSPILIAWLVAVLMRLALGSATASILAASALIAGLSQSLPGWEVVLILAVADGVTFATQPADSGFWLVKEYVNLDESHVLLRFNACRVVMSVLGVLLLLAWEALFF